MAEGSPESDTEEEHTESDDYEGAANKFLQLIEQGRTHGEIYNYIKSLSATTKEKLFPSSNGQNRALLPQIKQPAAILDFLPATCSQTGDIETVKLLLMYGFHPRDKGSKGSPLQLATYHNRRDIIDCILKCHEEMLEDDAELKACLAMACRGGHKALVSFWLGKLNFRLGKDYNRKASIVEFCNENDPLIAACEGGHPEIAELLLQEDVFFITSETVAQCGENLARCLEVWVEEDSITQRQKANWSRKHLFTFDSFWVKLPRYTNTLKDINLSFNSLKTIPSSLLWGCSWLETLELSNTELNVVPAPATVRQIDQSRMTNLILSNNNLEEVPAELFMLANLEELSLSHNRIKAIQVKQLQQVVSRTDPNELIWRCGRLKSLDLSHNQLSKIPSDIRAATQLTYLNVAYNKLTEMCNAWDCPLSKLNITGNQVKNLPDLHLHWQKSLSILELSWNNFVEIPKTVCRISALVELHLSNNQLDELPDKNAWVTPKLKLLDLSNKKDLSDKKDFNPHKPKPKRISMTMLTGQKRESCQRTSKSYVTSTIEFPDIFQRSLRYLDLSHSMLQAFPESICTLKALQVLKINGNQNVTTLPSTLSALKSLFEISLDPGQIKQPVEIEEAVLSDGVCDTVTIKRILREKLHNSQSYRGLKVMIIGPVKSGKTTLLEHITGCERPQPDRTVNVYEWVLQNPGNKSPANDEITFNVWDVKSGDKYEFVHQALFTPRTLFIIVWDASSEGSHIKDLEPWVYNVRSQAPQSSIVAIGTHNDLLPQSLDTQRMAEEVSATYHEITECIIVAANRQDRVKDLKAAVWRTASRMTYKLSYPPEEGLLVGRKVPEAYLQMKELLKTELGKLQRSQSTSSVPLIIKQSRLSHHLKTLPYSNIDTTEEEDAAVQFLRDAGTVIHVSDHTYQLTNLYFLDPSWLCDVLLAVVQLRDTAETHRNGNRVKREHLKNLCVESGFGIGRFEEYLQLLCRFEVALAAGNNEYLIPSLLPNRPVFVGEPCNQSLNQIQRWYKMSYIPPGFWRRLVSRLLVTIQHGRSDRNSSPHRMPSLDKSPLEELNGITALVCQSSIVINHDHGQIVVKPMVFPDNAQGVRVIIRSRIRNFKTLGFVVDHIENLIADWFPGLYEMDGLVDKLIPCPTCRQRMTSTESEDIFAACHVFHFRELAIAATMGGSVQMPCARHPDKPVSLREIVPDLFLDDINVPHMDESKLIEEHKLGEGSFGEVYQGKYDGKSVALKKLIKMNKKESKQWTEAEVMKILTLFSKLRSELSVMSQLSHPLILKLIGVSINQLCFAMELAPLGDLAAYIHEQHVSTRPQLVTTKALYTTILPRMLTYKICLQVTAALCYLHEKGVIHTDLKTDNILLFSTNPCDAVNLKLADYGISRNVTEEGAKAMAGFHAFRAPEVAEGKAFDEKVDLFSLGMLFYHIMSGVLPFWDDQSSVIIKTKVSAGKRPDFNYQGYSLLPHFIHLENLMQNCWKDSPNKRPNAAKALEMMTDASFYCLRQAVDIPRDNNGCLYPKQATQQSNGQNTDQANEFRLWMWMKEDCDRSVTVVDFDHDEVVEKTEEFPGREVLSGIQVDSTHILGTRSEHLQILNYDPQRKLFAHQTNLKVPSQVFIKCMHYQHLKEKTAGDLQGYLYTGCEDEKVRVYKRVSKSGASDQWKLHNEILLLTAKSARQSSFLTPNACQCMLMLEDRHELLVGCGNKVRIIKDFKLDSELEFYENEVVDRMIQSGSYVFCLVKDRPFVVVYDITNRSLFARFQCSPLPLSSLSQSLIRRQSTQTTQTGISADDSTRRTPKRSNELQESTKGRNVPCSLFDRRRSSSTDSMLPIQTVTALLIVKDSLWVGMSNGAILVVNIDNTFGDLVGVLKPHPMLGFPQGPVTNLFHGESGRVVSCRYIEALDSEIECVTPKTRKLSFKFNPQSTLSAKRHSLHPVSARCQIHVWEAWGIKEFTEFYEARKV